MWCLCRKSSNHSQHQTPFSPFRMKVQKSHGDANPEADACALRRHASLENVYSASTSTLGAKILNLSWSNTQIVPIVTVAICVGTTVTHQGDGKFTDTRSPVLTHLKSIVSRGRLECSRITQMKMAWALFCEECDIVQSDHAPQAGVAQGIFDGELIRRRDGHQVELEEELEEEVERRGRVRRDHSRHQTQVRMHG